MKRSEILFGIIKIPVDFIATILAILTAHKIRILSENFTPPIDFTIFPTIQQQIIFGTKAAILLLAIFAIGKMYSLKSTTSMAKEAYKSTLLWTVWVMAIITFFFFTRTFPASRLAIFYSWLVTLFFIIGGRGMINSIQSKFIKMGYGKQNILIIGSNNLSTEIALKLKNNHKYNILGYIEENNPSTATNPTENKTGIKKLGSISQLEYIVKRRKIDEIIQTQSTKQNQGKILEICDLKHIKYSFVPDMIEVRRTNIEISTLDEIPIITLKATPLDGWGKVTKRIVDIIGSLIGLVVLSPIMLLTALAIKIDSKGPILFTKLDDGSPVKRIGKYGKPFKFYKFRSMRPNTHNLRYTSLKNQNLRKEGPLIKIKNDPRITKTGKFIRKYSIDELPQLFNVLIGHMSLVGPRPHLPEEVAKYEKNHKFILSIKPGLTGLPQVNGRSDLDFNKEVKLDRYYIENWSILMDIKIIFKTIIVLLRGYKE